MTFEQWVATRRPVARLEDHAAGSSEYGGFIYEPGWIAHLPEERWYTAANNHLFATVDNLRDAEKWLWEHYAGDETKHEVPR